MQGLDEGKKLTSRGDRRGPAPSVAFAEPAQYRSAVDDEAALSLDQLNALAPKAPLARRKMIAPLAECVHRVGHTMTLKLGYESPNDLRIEIAVGRTNRFEPDPENRNQPTMFEPGVHRNEFEITIDKTVIWYFDGGRYEFAPGQPVQCGDVPKR